jgi:hypothetical protein
MSNADQFRVYAEEAKRWAHQAESPETKQALFDLACYELVYNVSNNGTSGDWYWEVITPEREIMARGLASTSAQARADAVMAGAAYSIKQPRLSLFGEDVLRL